MSVDFPFLHRVAIAVVATASFVAGASGEVAAGSTVPILYRIFLDDGGTLTSYGDYARVGQRVVLSLPVASFLPVAEPRTQLVSISAGRIDWTTTERYADAARYAHYAATRGEADYAALSRDVARSLNAIALLDDPVRALNLARVTRQRLVEWSQHSFGYREHDTHQIVSLLDEANSGLSIEVGEPAFELSFVATPPPRPPPPGTAPPQAEPAGNHRRRAHRVCADAGSR